MAQQFRLTRSQNDNLSEIYLGDITIWVSYETPVAFTVPGFGRIVSQNIWSSTTGRHLNEIDRGVKHSRIPHDRFTAAFALVLDAIGGSMGRTFTDALAVELAAHFEGERA